MEVLHGFYFPTFFLCKKKFLELQITRPNPSRPIVKLEMSVDRTVETGNRHEFPGRRVSFRGGSRRRGIPVN